MWSLKRQKRAQKHPLPRSRYAERHARTKKIQGYSCQAVTRVPSEAAATTERRAQEPAVKLPSSDTPEPTRTKLRIDTEEPKRTKLSDDRLPEMRVTRRTEIAEPIVQKSQKLIADPSRDCPRSDSAEPKPQKSSAEQCEPMR